MISTRNFLKAKNIMSSSSNNAAACRLSTIQRHLSTSTPQRQGGMVKVERMTVFGAGLMGAGIAQVAAQNGLKVRSTASTGVGCR
jgi:3-hydroxyacyl-CoA dehydrogenase